MNASILKRERERRTGPEIHWVEVEVDVAHCVAVVVARASLALPPDPKTRLRHGLQPEYRQRCHRVATASACRYSRVFAAVWPRWTRQGAIARHRNVRLAPSLARSLPCAIPLLTRRVIATSTRALAHDPTRPSCHSRPATAPRTPTTPSSRRSSSELPSMRAIPIAISRGSRCATDSLARQLATLSMWHRTRRRWRAAMPPTARRSTASASGRRSCPPSR